MFVSHNKNHYSKHLKTRKHIDIVQINERFITEEKEIHEEEEVDGTEDAFEDDFFRLQTDWSCSFIYYVVQNITTL